MKDQSVMKNPFSLGDTCKDTPTLYLSPATCNVTAALL